MPESGKHRKIKEKVTKVPFQKVLRVYHLFKWDQRLTVCTQILTISVIIKITLLLLAIHLMQVIKHKKSHNGKNGRFQFTLCTQTNF